MKVNFFKSNFRLKRKRTINALIKISEEKRLLIKKKLDKLYGNRAEGTYEQLMNLLNKHVTEIKNDLNSKDENTNEGKKFSHKDFIINTYADSIQSENKSPLEELVIFCSKYFNNVLNGIHVLPFYEWDTDRGFSVVNYYGVDSRNGTWDQFRNLKKTFDVLMVDCVLNHASIDNPIIQNSLIGKQDYINFALSFDYEKKPDEDDLSKITRARPNPVLTQYYVMNDGKKLIAIFDKPKNAEILKTGWVWTTFSRSNNNDGSVATRQVDLNFNNPSLLLEIIRIILFYIERDITWIRLDAVGYLWKKIGTTCLHLPETHIVIELIAEILSIIPKKKIVLISEVNEPQENALQYLGPKSIHKSDMIYLFTHYPLAIHAILTGTAKYYTSWLPSLTEAKGRLFISVLGTHDGMGMKPVGDWLPDEEKEKLQKILINKHGALPNFAKLPGGKKIVYELCATAWNFINNENIDETSKVKINRYLTVFALGLIIKGVPSIYINGIFGIPNDSGEIDENRSINRQILSGEKLSSKLADKTSIISQIFNKVSFLLNIRRNEKSFDLEGPFKVFNLNESVVSVLLSSSTLKDEIFSLINISNRQQKVKFENKIFFKDKTQMIDLITKNKHKKLITEHQFEIYLDPYQICWLK